VSDIYEKAWVAKRNVLNELRSNNMTIQELRFFSIYLSKINPNDISTRVVRFPLSDFQRIMGFGKLNLSQLRASTDSLLCKIVHIPDENGRGLRSFQLFKECHIFQDDNDEWFLEIDAHDKALPLMFDFKTKYFKYELWNALRLKSPNQVRMYEILKQYERIGHRELPVADLRALLGIEKNDYSGRTGWSDFKKKVLDSCQEALKQTTDICFTYERGKVGNGGKWLSVIFHIQKNTEYVDPLSLSEFITMQPNPEQISVDNDETTENIIDSSVWNEQSPEEDEYSWALRVYGTDQMAILASGCKYEFDKSQMEQIYLVLIRIHIPKDILTSDLTWGRQSYLRTKYAALNVEDNKKQRIGEPPIRDRFRYFLRMLEEDTFQPVAYSGS